MGMMDIPSLLLLVLIALGIISHNVPVSIALMVLLFVRLLHLDKLFPYLEQYGLTVGIVILTIGVMVPLASGKVAPDMIMRTFTNWKSLLAIGVGVFVSYIAGRGVPLMSENPLIVTGLLVGTIIGVAFFRGIPVGPLIAAGITALLLDLTGK